MDHSSSQPLLKNQVVSSMKEGKILQQRVENKIQITIVPVKMTLQNEPHESQFLNIDAQMMKKLQIIEQSKQRNVQVKQKKNRINSIVIKNSPPQQQEKQQQADIKRQFVHKLKKWQRQREQLKIRKQQIEQKKSKQKQLIKLKQIRQEQEQKQFLKLQKQKQIQQKIQQIQQRRQKRQQSLKNAILKRSYNQIPSYVDSQQKYRNNQQQQIKINMKILKNKKQLAKINPEQLKLHEKAYIQRIKQRLNMMPRPQKQQKAKSDFNLYLKRSQQKKRQEINKIVKMKKYQQKINRIPIKIDSQKKQQKLIQIDKIKNPQKYRLLSQKLLNDQQIFQQFKHFQININRKQIGINYLKELKQSHEKNVYKNRRSNSVLFENQEQRLPLINKKQKQVVKMMAKQNQKSKSVQLYPSQSYKRSLQRNRQKDTRYMMVLKQKLEMANDM